MRNAMRFSCDLSTGERLSLLVDRPAPEVPVVVEPLSTELVAPLHLLPSFQGGYIFRTHEDRLVNDRPSRTG